jgi:hypothetical protein
MDEKYLRDVLRQNLRIRAYLDQRFTTQPPNEDEERVYYRDHAGDFTINGVVAQFEQARDAIIQILLTARRDALVNDWVASLRRRATITEPQLGPR